MNWTLDELNAFVNSVKLGSFSAAARKMGKAQSRVSTAISNLEAGLGFELFDRSAKLPVLTPLGEEMYIEAQSVLAQCQRLNARAMTVTSGEEVLLTVAMDEAVPVNAFEALFQRISTQFPLLKLTIINGSQEDIAIWVDEGLADIGIMFHATLLLPDSLEFMSIGQFKQSLVVAPSHPLAAVPAPTLEQLMQYRQLAICDRAGHSQTKPLSANYWYIDSYYYIVALVLQGVGWALVPEHVAKSEWYIDDLASLSTEYITEPLLVEMGVVNRRDKQIGPVMHWLFDELHSVLS
ncbi:LysR family transcriptional regulator [Shewanella schlegeliana]|uniref:LysR family transcriptional regulator n=1 Tax=Shewanella schlegeliana TaxID=190308 RepID=A0ABS1T1T4_9GAMM|nr:LysR family transcriptional regulator [Shewanella schlegeliana]MBL4914759.1 LysR family transcriptional regulator [Shewanella schlegeliana]MCL1109909.1 LysR family transcriptional regulator [Shewanella schlegeliana]GIU25709.1 LysR family transcriptional regulator [Shewanella schlegeliana]